MCQQVRFASFRHDIAAACCTRHICDGGVAHAHARRRAPSQLEEAAESLAWAKSGDDGRVEVGRTERGVAGQGGRFFLFFTGFPFPLGPLFSRQTVRYEVCSAPEEIFVPAPVGSQAPCFGRGRARVGRARMRAACMLHRVMSCLDVLGALDDAPDDASTSSSSALVAGGMQSMPSKKYLIHRVSSAKRWTLSTLSEHCQWAAGRWSRA